MKRILQSRKEKQRWLALAAYAAIGLFLCFQCFHFQPAGITAEAGPLTREDLEAAECDPDTYKEGKGLVAIGAEFAGKGGVHVFLNGRLKLYIGKEPKNLRVSVGDILFVKGAELEGTAKVTILAVEGKIDASVQGECVEVGNLTKRLVKIRPCA